MLCQGNPHFIDADLDQLAKKEGAAPAWKAAFARHGADAPARVRGDFAVAVELDDGRAFLAVDRFAIRTLCYTLRGGSLRYSERADELAGTSPDIDPQAIFDYLYFHVIPSPRTIFNDVLRVPPGHCVSVQGGRATAAPFWMPNFEEGKGASFETLKAEFLAHVERGVAERLLGDKTGCYLSGGTDSSTVAGMLTKLSGKPAEAFSIGFDVTGYDEMEYARIAAKHFGVNHHVYYIKPEDLVAGMPAVAESYDQPFGNSSAVPAYYCARAARERGLERLLAGDGGDELFGGNTRYAKQKVFGVYGDLPGWFRKGIAEPAAGSGLLDRIPVLKKGASYVRQASVPMPDRMQTYNLLGRIGHAEIFTPDFLARIDTLAPQAHQREVYNAGRSASLVNKMLAFDWRYTLAENDLPKVVGSARLAGMDVGFPLLDEGLLDFSLQLPSRYKVKGLKLRWFFKEALRGFLPDAILTKKKHGFGLPFGHWAVDHAGLKSLSVDALSSLAARNVVRPQFIERLLKEHLPAHPGFYGELVWVLTMLELWLRSRVPAYKA
jgi:asparagine synthase (glutamine-hydrolysing)